jgi:hypothetical protein
MGMVIVHKGKKEEKPNGKNKFNYLIYALIVFAILLFAFVIINSKTARAAVYVTGFIVINMGLSSYKRFLKLPIEIEFLTLGIVLCTIQFGVKTGLVLAILGGILSFIVGFNITPFSFPMLVGYIIIAFVTFLIKGIDNIAWIGLIACLANNLFVFIVYNFAFDYDTFKNISFSLSNIIINGILFFNIAPLLLKFIF